MAKRRRGIGRASGHAEGAAYVEFLLAFVPILTLFLGLVQIGLLYAGNLVVQHAAHRAVRAAVVVLDDDYRYYEGEPRLTFDGRPATADDIEWLLARGEDDAAPRRPQGLSRRAAIEVAAMTPLTVLEPGEGDSIADALVLPPRMRRAEAVRRETNVEIRLQRRMAGGTEPARVFVRVEHGFACRVPVVRRFVCQDGRHNLVAEDWGAIHEADYAFREGDWGAE